jgi:hypothetical protein
MRPRCSSVLLAVALLAPAAHAQDLEPRAYTNLPIGLNFVLAGYAHSEGGLATDPTLPVDDAHLRIHTALFAYARSLDLWGHSGKFDVILPWSSLAGSALVAGEPRERDVSGLGDARLRLSLNFYGAPALSPADFAKYRPDLVAGASVQVTVPVGQYDGTRLINLGTNRWSIKPDVGFSQKLGTFMVDLTAGVTFFGRNDDYYGGHSLDQAPVWSTQVHLSDDFGGGVWAALGVTYYGGGHTTVDGLAKDDAFGNSRVGLTLSVPIDRRTSVKFNASRGISTRTGTNFDLLGVIAQYRWGAGL